MQFSYPVLSWLFLAFLAACSGVAGKTPQNNAQNNINNTNNVVQILKLRFLSPANGELSMASLSRALVELSVETQDGRPVAGERVDLRIDGAAAGSTLSSAFTISDETGRAGFHLSSGSNSSHFRVIVAHPQAVPLTLDVTVSSTGMVRLRVAFSYSGAVLPEDLGNFELGIAFDVSCEDLLPYAVPLDRVRRLSSWTTVEELSELPVDFPFSIVARGFTPAGEPLLHGCLVPDESMRMPNATVDVVIGLSDYAKMLPEPVAFEVPAPAAAAAVAAAERFASWDDAGMCPLGLAQALTDCLLSVMEGGDTRNCTPGNPTTESASLRARRGVLDAQMCRLSEDAGGAAGFEFRIHQVLGWQNYQEALSQLHAFLEAGRPDAVALGVQIVPDAAGMALEVTQIRFENDGLWRSVPSPSLARRRIFCPSHPDVCALEPFTLVLSWEELLVQDVSERFLSGAGIPPDGAAFSRNLEDGAVLEASPESLEAFFARELQVQLPDAVWRQAFAALGTKLGVLSEVQSASPQPDCQVSGSLSLSDGDADQYLDEVGMSLSFELYQAQNARVP